MRGTILPPHSRLPLPPRTDRRQRTRPLRPDRVRQNMQPALLQQHRRMIDQRHPQSRPLDPGRRLRLLDIVNKTRGSLRSARHHPSQSAKQSRRRGSPRIEKPLPVKVNRKFCHSTLFHEFPFTHNSQACPSMKVLFNAEAQRTQRKRREHNFAMSSLRFLRVLCVSALSAQPPRPSRPRFMPKCFLCAESTAPCSNLTHVPASDKCRSLHKEQRWLTSKSPGVPRRPLPLGARPRNNRKNQP